VVYQPDTERECPNCYYDKLTGSSTGKCKWTLEEALQKQVAWEILNPNQIRYRWFSNGRCPICKGQGYLTTERVTSVDCLIIWEPTRNSNSMVFTQAGSEGSTIVILKTDPQYYDLFKNSSHLVIDGVDCKMSKAPILRGIGNQSVLVITAFTTDKPKIDSGEIIKEYT